MFCLNVYIMCNIISLNFTLNWSQKCTFYIKNSWHNHKSNNYWFYIFTSELDDTSFYMIFLDNISFFTGEVCFFPRCFPFKNRPWEISITFENRRKSIAYFTVWWYCNHAFRTRYLKIKNKKLWSKSNT